MPAPNGKFIWYELMTTDIDAAVDFYGKVVGWTPQEFGGPGFRYTIVNAAGRGVGGVMEIPADAKAGGMPPMWTGYIYVDDVDAAAVDIREAGGKVYKEPTDIPDVGRFAVVADPQGAMFNIMKPIGPEQPPVAQMAPGHIGWRELYAGDSQKVFDFYAARFGWKKTQAMDMGQMGVYQLFTSADDDSGEMSNWIGGMMDKPADIPHPVWQFYFNVPEIDAAAARVSEGGGAVIMPAMEVPGGSWIIVGTDPQGAVFALVAPKR